jgi:hypothetical protein
MHQASKVRDIPSYSRTRAAFLAATGVLMAAAALKRLACRTGCHTFLPQRPSGSLGTRLAVELSCTDERAPFATKKEYPMKFAKTFYPAAILCLSAVGFHAHADNNTAKAGVGMTEDQIDQRYDAAKESCDRLSGNQKDVCEEKAKADRDTAKASINAQDKKADANREANEEKREANRDAAEEKRDAGYKVAKEKCDAMSGDAKDKCVDDAKARYNQ